MPVIDFEKLAKDLGVADVPTTFAPVASLEPQEQDCDEHGNPVESVNLPPIVDAATFVVEELVDPPELIKGLVHKGTKVVIGGGSKAFKTWTQLDVAICVAYGLDWMGFETVAGRVLFVNFEISPSFFQKRVRKICESRGIVQIQNRLDIWNLRGYSAGYKEIIPLIIARIKDAGYSLVILDPVYKLYGDTDENSAGDVAKLLNELERVCVETGAAVMFGAHYSKGNQAAKESIDRISGSGVFARDPDSIIPFTKHEEEDAFVIEPILRNLPPITPFVVRWNHPLMERDDELDPSKLKQTGGRPKEHTSDELLDLLNDGPLPLQKWQEIASKNNGISRATFFRLKSELKSHDLILHQKVSDTWIKLIKQ